MDEMIFTLVTHNNNNDIILWSWSILFDEVVGHAAQRVRVWCPFDHLQMPAGLISNRVGMTALLHILLCFEFVPPPNLLFFTFVFVLPRPPPFFARYELPSSIFFFWSENFCRTFGPADWRFLSDIMKKCPIVRQVRRISTALGYLFNAHHIYEHDEVLWCKIQGWIRKLHFLIFACILYSLISSYSKLANFCKPWK